MARRETYLIHFHCPKCLRSGSSKWQENENPVHHGGRLDEAFLGASDGFSRLPDGDIACAECGVKTVPGRAPDR